MGAYIAFGQDTNTAATTVASLSQPASALKRLKVNYVQVGSDVSADNAYEAALRRTTAAGTSTAYTPVARDPADGAASGVFGYAHTIEPTYTANADVLPIFGHQRATYQWYAAPGHDIVIPVTNSAGVGYIVVTAATAFNQGVVLEWEE